MVCITVSAENWKRPLTCKVVSSGIFLNQSLQGKNVEVPINFISTITTIWLLHNFFHSFTLPTCFAFPKPLFQPFDLIFFNAIQNERQGALLLSNNLWRIQRMFTISYYLDLSTWFLKHISPTRNTWAGWIIYLMTLPLSLQQFCTIDWNQDRVGAGFLLGRFTNTHLFWRNLPWNQPTCHFTPAPGCINLVCLLSR